jgi:Leucine-rich repeat (LRR) protein/Tol biopolymer transport system component
MKISKLAANFRKVLGPVIAVLLCLAAYIPAASPVKASGNGTGILWGFGSMDTSNNPSLSLVGLGNIASFDAGYGGHSLAVTTDGYVYAWGDNSSGQLGQGTSGSSSITAQNPVEVLGGASGTTFLNNVKSVSAGSEWSVAVKNDGTVWTWGNNSGGYLGNGKIGTGSTQFVTTPVQVIDPSGGFLTHVVAVSAGLDCTLALKDDGTVWSWGFNWVGELGNGTVSYTAVPTPVQVVGLTGVTSISAADSFCIALTGGNVYAWGGNTWSNLGDGNTYHTQSYSSTPVEVVGVDGGHLSGIDLISARGVHCLAFSASAGNVIYGWGSDAYGALAQPYTNGTYPYFAAPIPVYEIGAGSGSVIGDGGVMIGAGMFRSMIKLPNYSIVVCGNGFGPSTSQDVGVNIISLNGIHDVSDISAGNALYMMGPARIATSTVVTSSVPSPSNWGQDVTFTATVTGGSGYTPTGQVNFGLNGSPTSSYSTTLNASAQSAYTMPGSSLQGGSNTIPARYLGDFSNAPSTSPTFTQTVNKLTPTITFTSAPNPSAVGQNVTFTITAAGSAGTPTGSAVLYDGDSPLTTLTLDGSGDASYSTTGLALGSHLLVAHYNGDSNYSSSNSGSVLQSVHAPGSQVVTFPDIHLEAVIRSALHMTTGDIHVSDLAALTSLDANGQSIAGLTGLEYCTGLTYLNLYGNQITDISQLASLVNLNYLYLQGNQITDISPLQYCTGLTYLNLNNNRITDISQLASLTNLTRLDIQMNHITDVSPLHSLVNLTFVELDSNQITDMSPLTALVNLTDIYLNYNRIVTIPDISGLTHLQTLDLADNQIQDISSITSLSSSLISTLQLAEDPLGNNTLNPALDFSKLTHLYYLNLENTSLKAMPGVSGLVHLAYLELSYNQIPVISDLSGLSALINLDLSNNYLTSLSPLASLTSFNSGGSLDVSENYLIVTEGSPAKVIINSFTSKGVTVTYSPQVTTLAFTLQPVDTAAGATINTVAVTIQDGNGNTAASSALVTIAIGTNPAGNGILSGTKTVAAVNGVAIFSGLSINKTGNAYTLTASSSGLTGASSGAFSITAPTPTGKIVFYSQDANGDYEIYIMNADGSNRTQLTFDSANDGAPSLSPDGTKIVYTSYRDGHREIWKMNSDGTAQTRLDDLSSYSSGLTDDNPSWSPDGTEIVFQSQRLVWNNIYIINADGTGLTQVNPSNGSENIYPSFSPDGKKIIFESGNGLTINTIKPDGTGLTPFYTGSSSIYAARYSPDGTKIVYYLESTNQIYTMDASGGTPTNIGPGAEPLWSPDSQFIIFYNSGIKIMSASGSAVSSLSTNSYDQDPSWGTGSVVSRTINPAVSFAVYGIATGQPVTAGQQESITVAAKDTSGNPATGYTGTIHFISGDSQATLPADYTFTSTDNGVHNFTSNTGGVTLATAGTQSVTATDKSHSNITGTQSGIQVVAGPLYVLVVSGISNPITVGVPGTVVVRIEDQYGNTVNYNINNSVNIHFTSSDSIAALPASYTFSSADNGVHTFTNGVTFNTSGTQSVTATRTGEYSPITGAQSGIAVNPVSSTTTTTTSTTTTTTVNPPSLSRDATLRSLTVSTGTISPVFSSGTTSYTANVLNSITSVTVTPTVNQANATVTVNGVAVSSGAASVPISLNVGDNTITLIVTAQDGTTRAGYMLTVTRAASNDATLSNLTISPGTLTPVFAAGTTSYTSGVAYGVPSITVSPTVNESHATVKVNGVSVTGGSPSGAIALGGWYNTITIVVTAQDTVTTDTYTVVVAVASPSTTPTVPVGTTTYVNPQTSTITTTATTTTSTTTTTLPPGTTNFSGDVNSTGTFTSPASASSANGDVTVNIPAGVTGLTAGGAPLTQITIVPLTTDLPALPSDGAAVGVYFDIQPSGSTFSSPITITESYDPSLIPTGTSPYLAWYNPATGQWEQLTTVSIDTVNHTITASVNHFSTFAVLAALSETSTTTSTAAGTATNNTNTTTTIQTTTAKPSANGVIIGVIIGAVIVIALILLFIIRGRKPRGG